MAELKRELANRALKHHKKQSDELNELRRKTKHQEAALRTLTQVGVCDIPLHVAG